MSEEPTTREELLEAAYEVLVAPEYEGLTTAAVAEAAGRNQSLVHYYFETKRDLVLALFEHLHGILEDHLEAAADEDDPVDRLVAILTYLVGVQTEAAGGPTPSEEVTEFKRGLLWLNAQAAYDPELREAMAADLEYLRETIEATLREGIERGCFRDVDPAATTALLLAAVGGAQNWGAIYGTDAADDLVLEAMERLVAEWLRT